MTTVKGRNLLLAVLYLGSTSDNWEFSSSTLESASQGDQWSPWNPSTSHLCISLGAHVPSLHCSPDRQGWCHPWERSGRWISFQTSHGAPWLGSVDHRGIHRTRWQFSDHHQSFHQFLCSQLGWGLWRCSVHSFQSRIYCIHTSLYSCPKLLAVILCCKFCIWLENRMLMLKLAP